MTAKKQLTGWSVKIQSYTRATCKATSNVTDGLSKVLLACPIAKQILMAGRWDGVPFHRICVSLQKGRCSLPSAGTLTIEINLQACRERQERLQAQISKEAR
jgi:hypothetical protein